jgi:hypothetical protein
MATAHIEVAHVYKALAEILKSLSVEKNGTLPGNMGGKSYITAVDASAEVKRQFVANDLVFIPNEEVITNEHIVHKDRMNIRIVIRGEYTIVSTVDGSQVTVSGIGDGLATGTAVAANIGSTNALKNALLRTFLITEQSVEDESKNGASQEPPAALKKAQERAAERPTPPRQAASGSQQKIVAEFIDPGKASREQVNDLTTRIKNETGKKGEDLFAEVYKALSNGEVG